MNENILEELSELEHVQWCKWAASVSKDLQSLLEIIEKSASELSDEDRLTVFSLNNKLDKWDRLMVPYSDLPEDEKEKDRAYAREVLSIFEP